MSIPKPGKPVRGSTTGAPLMALFDLLGRRWAMGVLWNLAPRGPSTFRALQDSCVSKSGTISPSILNTRIKELEEAKLLVRGLQGYELTPLGHELFDLLEPFRDWAQRWARELETD